MPAAHQARTWQGRCTGGLLNLFVRASGQVTPCSALAFPSCTVGDVRHESLVDICRQAHCKDVLAWLEAESRTGACAGCLHFDRCGLGCPEILLSMCSDRSESEYCYHRIEQ